LTLCSVQHAPSLQLNFQSMIKDIKQGMVLVDLPESGHIILRGVHKDQLNIKNITVSNHCHFL